MRRVQVTEPGGIKEAGQHYLLGTIVSSDDVQGDATLNRWVAAGWCVDLETGEQRERSAEPVSLAVHDTVQRMSTVM